MNLEEMKNTLDFAHSNTNRYGKQDSDVIEMCILIKGYRAIGINSMISDNGKIIFVPQVDLKIDEEDTKTIKEIEKLKNRVKEKDSDLNKRHSENLRITSENIILKKKIITLENKLNATENSA